LTPRIAPNKVPNTKYFNKSPSYTLYFIKVKELVKEAQEAANLLVPSAKAGGTPSTKSPGRLIIPPPPAIESIKAAANPIPQSATIYSIDNVTTSM
jgi:hypothetical protein